ncbi:MULTISPECIES: acyl carrier protein [unclassified Burkholderia]|uniref:acyl carrier protein n=1 Tax=unclassified Burkholderia TaxID=2613784 RepID=UPI000F583AA4|nr:MULTISPECIES: acyl carrier protein [unclassified Burkholderia]RQR70561.1 acyl carrier protein [Burkholderia sp. Bp9012]RQR77838.1 acyl carrier protein [Burkholderia sp. Bp9011]RQR87834.1 acyl carrier protein [Burkholderia sp. Bp9010]RQZ43774.1 acyl carrier protein [Burkholderia sp. Bp9099]
MIEISDFVMQLVASKTRRLVDTNWWNVPLDELGLTSIDLAEILFDIEEHFNVEIRLDHLRHDIHGMLTLRQITESLASLLPPKLNSTLTAR